MNKSGAQGFAKGGAVGNVQRFSKGTGARGVEKPEDFKIGHLPDAAKKLVKQGGVNFDTSAGANVIDLM
ncbi:MAG: hypothetical protein ACKVJ2_12730, partial [Pseudomonadales bacterium]